eukprot:TRINITY_DN24208_c0_g1_i1.p1 TRINITY_DN24208_c0_g1~~TRINITY_DN24208_c0_g1_i1.p1  ORF type:complete len:168 (+),score=38.38 TRINITY_DN24208_c0_g1_i1:46-504(+)
MFGAAAVCGASAVAAFVCMVAGVVASDALIGAVFGCPTSGAIPLHLVAINLVFALIFAISGGVVVRVVASILGKEHEHMAVLTLVLLITVMNGVCLFMESRADPAASKKKDDDKEDTDKTASQPQLPKWFTLALSLISVNGILFGAYGVYPW